MRMRKILAFAWISIAATAIILGVPAFAADPPVARDSGQAGTPLPSDTAKMLEQHRQALGDLYDRLAKAKTDDDATPIRADIRQLWLQTGSPTIDLLLARDSEAALAHDESVRRQLLDAASKLAPDTAEIWNRRAGLEFASEHYEAAIADLGHVLALEPRHFDALEALAGVLKESGRKALALRALRQLKEINPMAANLQSEIDDLSRKVEGQKI